MKCSVIACLLAICLLFGGCDMGFEGDYIWQQSHPIPEATEGGQSISASDYKSLYAALEQAVEAGVPQLTVSVASYDRTTVEQDVAKAVDALRKQNPVAAYSVQDITWELGSIGGEQVVVAQLTYLYDQAKLKRILTVADNNAANDAISMALQICVSNIVIRVKSYEDMDFIQLVEDFAFENPQIVMETPQVNVSIYPESGSDRVVELQFTYQTSRDTLRNMQTQVATVVEAAVDMVSVTAHPRGKYAQMYALLMERFPIYTQETSITPGYSMLVYGVGDSRAFATVYAALCRQAGLECLTVVGARNGEPYYWNIIHIDGIYYHMDLLRSKEEGKFREMTDQEMEGYVWDYFAYPACVKPETLPEGD